VNVTGRHFAPYCEVPDSPPVGLGPQVVNLTEIAQVFRTMYRGPWDKDVPLPPHYWEIQNLNDPFLFLESTRSDKYGFSGLPMTIKSQRRASASDPGEVKFVHLKKMNQDEQWYLTLRPDIPRAARAMVVQTGEIWIDLDTNTWVTKQEFPQHTQQRLLRLPLWTSRWKALSGGFVDGPAGKFQIGGIVTTAELVKPFGTVKRPWRILMDASWWRTFLQFRYYDLHWRLHINVPPGLTVKALGKKLDPRTLTHVGNVVGGGTTVAVNGGVFVLHERTEEASGDVQFAFEDTSGNVRYVDNVNQSLERKPAKEVPADIDKRYVLPKAWHSFGWQARVGDQGERKPWSELRPTSVDADPSHGLATSEASPLIFHLDDAILYGLTGGQVGPSVVEKGARVTLFNHRLAYRGTADDLVPQWWKTALDENYLPAEEGVANDTDSRVDTTLVVHHEGEFHTLRDLRVEGAFGAVRGVGARKAMARGADVVHQRSLVEGDMVYTVLIADAYDGIHDATYEGPFLAKNPDAKLCHLMVVLPLRLLKDKGEPFGSPPYPDVSDQELKGVYDLLLRCEERWDELHPAHGPFASPRKDYVAVPEKGIKAGTRVVKVRHFFCPRATGQFLSIRVTHEPGRSYVTWLADDAIQKWMLLRLGNPNNTGQTAKDSDQAVGTWFTLAHELGHVMSLPDEYMESIDVSGLAKVSNELPKVPRFPQRDIAYPFRLDRSGMMNSNMLPRMRYYAHRVAFLNGAGATVLPDAPYVLHHPTLAGGTTYRLASGTTPWRPFQSALLSGRRAFAALFRAGEDEATVEHIFPRPARHSTAAGAWLDGILVIRTLIWFSFVASNQGTLTSDERRWAVLHDFYTAEVMDPTNVPRARFLLVGPADALMSRIGAVLEVRVEFGPKPTILDDKTELEIQPGVADFVVDVVYQNNAAAKPKPAWPSPHGSAALRVPQFELGSSLLRYALGAPFNAASPDNSPLGASDMDPVLRAVEMMVGAATGSFVAKVL